MAKEATLTTNSTYTSEVLYAVQGGHSTTYPRYKPMKSSMLAYSLKVWLTSVFLASLLVTAEEVIFDNHSLAEGLSFYLIIFVVSFFFSIPSFILLGITTHYVQKLNITITAKKGILSLSSLVLTSIAFYLASEAFSTGEMLALAGVYYLVILVGTWFYSFVPAEKTKPQTEEKSPDYLSGSYPQSS